jgi:hypothetical protein
VIGDRRWGRTRRRCGGRAPNVGQAEPRRRAAWGGAGLLVAVARPQEPGALIGSRGWRSHGPRSVLTAIGGARRAGTSRWPGAD